MATVRKLFGAEEIARRVEELAGGIADATRGDLTIVAILKGSFVFVADLARALDRAGVEPRIEFLRLASYGHAKESSGGVRLIGAVPADLGGRRVLLVDDIVDTGRSLAYAGTLLLELGASRVWTCALVDKPSRREMAIAADFVGFTISDLFVVGYGIDHAEDFRHLPYIGTVD